MGPWPPPAFGPFFSESLSLDRHTWSTQAQGEAHREPKFQPKILSLKDFVIIIIVIVIMLNNTLSQNVGA